MDIVLAFLLGVVLWFFARYGVGGFYTIGPNERAVLCTFGRAQRLEDETTLSDPIADKLNDEERQRYEYPQVRVVGPGFYWKLPWQTLHKVSIATSTVSIAFDPEDASANSGGHDPGGRHQGSAEHGPVGPDPLHRCPSATCTRTCSA